MINHFRSAVYSVILCFRLTKLYRNTMKILRTQSLKTFTNYYETLDGELKNWIFHSVRIPYLSILNFDQLKIDMTEFKSIFSSENEIKEKYIRLEVNIN